MIDFLATTRRLAGAQADRISISYRSLQFPDDVDDTGLDILGSTPITSLSDGIAETLEFFRALDQKGELGTEDHGLVVDDGVARDVGIPYELPLSRRLRLTGAVLARTVKVGSLRTCVLVVSAPSNWSIRMRPASYAIDHAG